MDQTRIEISSRKMEAAGLRASEAIPEIRQMMQEAGVTARAYQNSIAVQIDIPNRDLAAAVKELASAGLL